MNKLDVADKILRSLGKMTNLNFNSYQHTVLHSHIQMAWAAGFDEGWRQRSAKHSFRRIRRMKGGQVQEYDSLKSALASIGGGSKSNLAKAARGQAKNKHNPHLYKGYYWEYI